MEISGPLHYNNIFDIHRFADREISTILTVGIDNHLKLWRVEEDEISEGTISLDFQPAGLDVDFKNFVFVEVYKQKDIYAGVLNGISKYSADSNFLGKEEVLTMKENITRLKKFNE